MIKELLITSENILLENFKALLSISLSVIEQTQQRYETGWQQISNGLNQRWKCSFLDPRFILIGKHALCSVKSKKKVSFNT